MKKILVIITSLILLLSFNLSYGQDDADYFVGNWDVVVKGTPSGDAKMKMHLERAEGKLTGNIKPEGVDAVEISKVNEEENKITVYYSAAGYDLYMSFEKKDPNNCEGSLINMFDAKGERIEEE
ncbi:hypothetical protein SLH46_18320 [Draconibacterium sp. IB214405]|uniref:hypothetical protein n=1 Tax=Draconibacterium sp. IB214405 TaxID=3097352 RepID=UPI002A0F62E0|nr:hypothetical protein [Draconibacterium sp. IB214405]MDX8341160.1 hypothetical protein [Draconibacterium sp. IB214405]